MKKRKVPDHKGKKRTHLWIFWGIIGALAFLFSTHTARATDDSFRFKQGENVLMGVGAVMSGEYAHLGVEIKNGVEMAIQEMRYILGHKVELIAEDDRCEPEPTVKLAEKFSKNPRVVGVIGYMCTPGTLAALDLHETHKVPLISPTSSNFMLTAKGASIIYRVRWNNAFQGDGLALYAMKKGLKRAAVFHDDSASSIGIVERFQDLYRSKGGQLLYGGVLPGNSPELRALVRGLKMKGPNLLYFSGNPSRALELQREIREAKLRAPVFYDERCLDPTDFIREGGKDVDGAYITTLTLTRGKNHKQWTGRYRDLYGEPGIYSSTAYDAAKVLLQTLSWTATMQTDGSISLGKEKILESIRFSKFDGVTGPIQFDENGDRMNAQWVLMQVKAGKTKPVASILLK